MTAEQCINDIVQKMLPHVEGKWDSLNIDADLSDEEPDIILAYVEAGSKVVRPLPEIPEAQPLVLELVELSKDGDRGECCRCQATIARDGSMDLCLEYRDDAGG